MTGQELAQQVIGELGAQVAQLQYLLAVKTQEAEAIGKELAALQAAKDDPA